MFLPDQQVTFGSKENTESNGLNYIVVIYLLFSSINLVNHNITIVNLKLYFIHQTHKKSVGIIWLDTAVLLTPDSG